jgi:phosphoribosylglycinamide formyltransferase-1
MKHLAIFISGRGSNLEAILDQVAGGVLAGRCVVTLVFTDNPAAPGLAIARRRRVDTVAMDARSMHRLDFDAALAELLERVRPDLIALAGYMRIVTPELVRRYRIVNLHPADTARHRGLHGYRWAFEQRLPTTTITVHWVDEGLDTGPVIAREVVDLAGADSEAEVERRGLAVEHRLYPITLAQLLTDTDPVDARGADARAHDRRGGN